MLVDNVKIKN